MESAMWILSGAVVGWAGFTCLKFNAKRGRVVSVLIGMAGGYLGGSRLAPLLNAAMAVGGDFNPLALFAAFASAAACVIIGDMIYNRFGV